MKEIEIKGTDQIQDVRQAEQKKGLKPIARMIKRPGQKLFEWDMATGDITEVHPQPPKATVGPDGKAAEIPARMITKPGCLYKFALNMKNARKKFYKEGMEILAEQQKQNA